MAEGTRSKYKTKQRESIINCLMLHEGQHITASDICAYFKENGMSVGQSTVYRQLESLVDEGVIKKYIIDPNTPACFEYIHPEASFKEEVFFHCKCEKCGKLIHLHCDELKEIESHLYKHHNFKINPLRTVFYGICDECMSSVKRKARP